MKGKCPKVVAAQVFTGRLSNERGVNINLRILEEKCNCLLAVSMALRGRLLFTLFGQFLPQAALTVAMHFRLIAVLADIARQVILLSIVLHNCYQWVKSLYPGDRKDKYGNDLFQKIKDSFMQIYSIAI